MDFHIEERQAWLRTATHTLVLDRDREFEQLRGERSGSVKRLARIWLADSAGDAPRLRAYLGSVCFSADGSAQSQLFKVFRRLAQEVEGTGESTRALRRRLVSLLPQALLADNSDDASEAIEDIADELDLSAPEPDELLADAAETAQDAVSDAGESAAEVGADALEDAGAAAGAGGAALAVALPGGDASGDGGKKKKTESKPKKEKAPKVAKPAKPAKAPRKRATPPPRVSGRAYAFVCSECYDEYLLPTSYSEETVTCPECLHVGRKPDDNFLRTVAMHKAGEQKTGFAVALCGILMFLSIFGLIWINTAGGSDMVSASSHQAVSYGLMGASALLGILFLWLLVRFEGNRWEVYF